MRLIVRHRLRARRHATSFYALKDRDGQTHPISNQQANVLLAMMLFRSVSKDKLIELIFPNPHKEPEEAPANLRTQIMRVNRRIQESGWQIVSAGGKGNAAYSLR